MKITVIPPPVTKKEIKKDDLIVDTLTGTIGILTHTNLTSVGMLILKPAQGEIIGNLTQRHPSQVMYFEGELSFKNDRH